MFSYKLIAGFHKISFDKLKFSQAVKDALDALDASGFEIPSQMPIELDALPKH